MKNLSNTDFINQLLDELFPLSEFELTKNLFDREFLYPLLKLALEKFNIDRECFEIARCADTIFEMESNTFFRIISIAYKENDTTKIINENKSKIEQFSLLSGFGIINFGSEDQEKNEFFGLELKP